VPICLVFRPVQTLRVGGLRWIYQHGKISDNRFRRFETGLNLHIAYIGWVQAIYFTRRICIYYWYGNRIRTLAAVSDGC
jgi:hypothetical protein